MLVRWAVLLLLLLAGLGCVKEKEVDLSRRATDAATEADASQQQRDAHVVGEDGATAQDAAFDSAVSDPDATVSETDATVSETDATVSETDATSPIADASVPDAIDPCSHMCTGSAGKSFCLGERGTQKCQKNNVDGLQVCTCSATGWISCGPCLFP